MPRIRAKWTPCISLVPHHHLLLCTGLIQTVSTWLPWLLWVVINDGHHCSPATTSLSDHTAYCITPCILSVCILYFILYTNLYSVCLYIILFTNLYSVCIYIILYITVYSVCLYIIWKICTESRDIDQNVSNFAGLVWKADFGHFFGNILGLCAYFSKLKRAKTTKIKF